jgi:hypothetical protein
MFHPQLTVQNPKPRSTAARFLIAALGIGVLVLLAPARQAQAAWQLSQIEQGDGHGGSICHPAYKQEVRADSGRTLPFGLAQMDNGQIAMVVASQPGFPGGGPYYPKITFSSDGGNTWSAFQGLPTTVSDWSAWPVSLAYTGGGNLSYVSGGRRYFSTNYGNTWSSNIVDQQYHIPGGGYVTLTRENNASVDRTGIWDPRGLMEIGYYATGRPYPESDGFHTVFRYSLDGGHTWQGNLEPPSWTFPVEYNGKVYQSAANEGCVVRAKNGDLVAALRPNMPPRFFRENCPDNPYDYDNLDGMGISISHDSGTTWSPITTLYEAGRHHANLDLLPNGDLVMTFIMRDDIDPGESVLASHNRGLEALVSHDNGQHWNLDQQFTLDEFDYYNPAPGNQWLSACGHVATIMLSDGSMLAAYGKDAVGAAMLIKWDPADCPEPATCWLLTTGAVCLLVYTWRKRKAYIM